MTEVSPDALDGILDLARKASASGGNWVGVYQAIIDAVSTTVVMPAVQGQGGSVSVVPKGIEAADLTWLRGAQSVNGGFGAFASLIRGYTSRQYLFRTGEKAPEQHHAVPQGRRRCSRR